MLWFDLVNYFHAYFLVVLFDQVSGFVTIKTPYRDLLSRFDRGVKKQVCALFRQAELIDQRHHIYAVRFAQLGISSDIATFVRHLFVDE